MTGNKNVYMGPNSTAGILVDGKVNEDWEILLTVYATAYDSINNYMLTRIPGQFDPTTEREVRGRFWVLKRLAKKYATEELPTIEKFEKLSLDHLNGKISDHEFLRRLRSLVRSRGISEDLINYVEARIDAAERMHPHNFVDQMFGVPGPHTPQTPHPSARQKKKHPSTPQPELQLITAMFGAPVNPHAGKPAAPQPNLLDPLQLVNAMFGGIPSPQKKKGKR